MATPATPPTERAPGPRLTGAELRRWFVRPDGAPVPVLSVQGGIGAGKTSLLETLVAAGEARGLRVLVVREDVEALLKSGLLQDYYNAGAGGAPDPKAVAGTAYALQSYVFVLRVRRALEQARLAVARAIADGATEPRAVADLVVMERDIETDRYVFVEAQRGPGGPLPENYVGVYDDWWDLWAELVPFASTHRLFLDPDVATLQARVAVRARESERPAGDAPESPVSSEGGEFVDDEVADVSDDGEPVGSRGGGVTDEYQAKLRRAHRAWLLGAHPEEFPGLAERAAMARAVVWPDAPACPPLKIVGEAEARADFRAGTPGGAALAASVFAFVGL